MTMPVQRPHRSKQDYGTPWELIRAVEKRWGKLAVDLAANTDGGNAKAPRWLDDALTAHWAASFKDELCWLNPPFTDIGAWAYKCKFEMALGARVIMLTPASVGAEWFADHVEGVAHVVALRPRVVFEGCKDPYPKDCMLTLWGIREDVGFETWRWR